MENIDIIFLMYLIKRILMLRIMWLAMAVTHNLDGADYADD